MTLVILAGFAGAADILIDRQIQKGLVDEVTANSTQLATRIKPTVIPNAPLYCSYLYEYPAQIRLFSTAGKLLCSQSINQRDGAPQNVPEFTPPARTWSPSQSWTYETGDYHVAVQALRWPAGRKDHTEHFDNGWLVYAQTRSSTTGLVSDVRVFLGLGVLGGALLAMIAGLYVARRAMRPITELTVAAREIELTRDPTLRIPHPEAEDEIAELARTLEGMLGALDAARTENENALIRQREFVADASHELRTPLTSVLANLELLADELSGEQADSAKSALRSTRRMRRLVGDLLLLARADAQRDRPREPTDLAEVLTDAAGELGPAADSHEITIDAAPATVLGIRDDLHRVALNLLENALNHTPPGTTVSARTGVIAGLPTLVIEDDGPGIPIEMRRHVFDRFVRVGGDTGGGGRGTGLGLAIVRAVADAHGATVALGSPNAGSGTRFEITFPKPPSPKAGGVEPQDQTSTTTGSTIGRRRSRS